MSAETLRRAAALMRERAAAATQDVHMWEHEGHGHMTGLIDDDGIYGRLCRAADAEHIASWHPAVALAVADWLEDEAFMHDNGRPMSSAALAVARAYLGEAS